MQEPQGAAELKLDTLTRSVRFAAGIAPKAATRIGLGMALALEDSSSDVAGELLGVKIAEGVSGVASTIGAIGRAAGTKTVVVVSSAKDVARSVSDRVGASGSAFQKVPALNAAAGFVSQAASELKGSWDAAGYVSVEVVAEEPASVDETAPELPAAQASIQPTI